VFDRENHSFFRYSRYRLLINLTKNNTIKPVDICPCYLTSSLLLNTTGTSTNTKSTTTSTTSMAGKQQKQQPEFTVAIVLPQHLWPQIHEMRSAVDNKMVFLKLYTHIITLHITLHHTQLSFSPLLFLSFSLPFSPFLSPFSLSFSPFSLSPLSFFSPSLSSLFSLPLSFFSPLSSLFSLLSFSLFLTFLSPFFSLSFFLSLPFSLSPLFSLLFSLLSLFSLLFLSLSFSFSLSLSLSLFLSFYSLSLSIFSLYSLSLRKETGDITPFNPPHPSFFFLLNPTSLTHTQDPNQPAAATNGSGNTKGDSRHQSDITLHSYLRHYCRRAFRVRREFHAGPTFACCGTRGSPL
jgi:hypothetical protein